MSGAPSKQLAEDSLLRLDVPVTKLDQSQIVFHDSSFSVISQNPNPTCSPSKGLPTSFRLRPGECGVVRLPVIAATSSWNLSSPSTCPLAVAPRIAAMQIELLVFLGKEAGRAVVAALHDVQRLVSEVEAVAAGHDEVAVKAKVD